MLFKGQAVHTAEFLTEESKEGLRELIEADSPGIIVLSSPRLAVVVPFIRSLSGARIIVDTHDVHVQRCQSILDSLPFWDFKERLKQWLLVQSYGVIEKTIYKEVDVAWALKEEDQLLLESFDSVRRVDLVPNVVDPEMVNDLGDIDDHVNPKEVSCVFIGDYSYKPNEHSALMLIDWFEQEPIKSMGSLLYLIGVNPSEEMMARAEPLGNVHVTGEVPDLRSYYHPVDAVFLAPLLAGGGVKRKVIEAMACGCPVITTEVGAEGLRLVDGVTAEICKVDAFPERIVGLCQDRATRVQLSRNAQDHILSQYGYETLRDAVKHSISHLECGSARQGSGTETG